MASATADFLGALVDSLVATLKHESPYCVAAAAGLLGWLFRNPDLGQKAFADSGAIPALVEVVETAAPSEDLQEASGMFRWYAPKNDSVQEFLCVSV
jgi:hypothetical protein